MTSDPPAIELDSLLPWHVIGALGGDDDAPHARPLRGAILVADIAGYTRIAEKLYGLGDEGIGQLSDLLNREFGKYMNVVAEHGGEMISFAGDALIACFLDQEAADTVAGAGSAARARACARALGGLSGSVPEIADERVALHLGVATGPIWLARLGGWYGHWEMLVGGEAVRSAFAAASAASVGQVLVREHYDQAPPPLDAARSGTAGVFAGTDTKWAYGLVHPRVLEETRVARPLGPELRQVAALFVRVHGLDERRPDALRQHQDWIFAVHEARRAVWGSIGRFLIDDHGLVFVLVVGDPGNARADDLERLLSFAHSLELRARSLHLGLGMGLATGRAFCGVIGSRLRRQYVTIGAPMNLAARLMDSNSRGLLVALPFPAHRIPRFKLVPTATLDLKGLREPVAAARVEEQTDSETLATGLHGRQPELDALTALIESARGGKGGLATIIGDAGMGKSALLGWLRRRAAELHVRCLVGEGDLTESASPYFAFRPIVRALLVGDADETAATLQAGLVAWLNASGRSSEFAPLFNSVLPLRLPETETTDQLRGQTRAEVLGDLLVDLVRSALTEPLAIFIEDAHWVDSASVQLLNQLLARLDNVLVVLTARPEAERGSLEPLMSRAPLLRLDLQPLEFDAVGGICAAACGAPFESAAIALTQEQTQGNPFFVQEYVRALRDAGQLVLVDGRWRLGKNTQQLADVPVTLHGVVGSRIDSLPIESQEAIRAASVIGQQIDPALLADVLGQTRSMDVASVLASLCDRHLVVRDADGGNGELKFAHAVIQAVAYETLLVETRRTLHRTVAEVIERRKTPGLGHHVLLVHHWFRARDMSRTLVHAEAAAEDAIRSGAYREARSFAELCIEQAAADSSLASTSRQMRWRLTLADAALGLGDLPRRGSHASETLALAGKQTPKSAVWALLRGWGVLLGRSVRRRYAPSGPPSPEGADAAGYLARAYHHMALVSFFANEPLHGLFYATRALVSAEKGKHSTELPVALAEVGAWFGFANLGVISRHYFRDAFELAERLEDRPSQTQVSMIHSLCAVGRGDWQDVLADVDRCQALCLQIGDRVQWGNAQIVRFWHHHYRANETAAEQAARDLEDWASESGNTQQLSWALHARGLGAMATGAIADARDLLVRSVELIEHSPDRTAHLSTQASLALAYTLTGESARGLTLARHVLNEIEKIGWSMGHALTAGLSHIAEVMVGEFQRNPTSALAAAEARASVRLLRRQAGVFPVAAPGFRYWDGQLKAIAGRRSIRTRRRGLESARVLGMTRELRRLQEAIDGGEHQN